MRFRKSKKNRMMSLGLAISVMVITELEEIISMK